jgi:hypothetical protein
MNTMNLPGFTAKNSIYKTISHFQSKAGHSFGRVNNSNQLYLQKPNKDNTAGGKCHATHSGGTIYAGKYNSEGHCCAPTSTGKLCVNCDNSNNTCGDGHTTRAILHTFTRGNLRSGTFARV